MHTAGRLARGGEHDHPQQAVFHGALGYAVELGLLPANPIGLVRWRAPRAAAAVSPATVASPAQVRAILTQVSRIKPELAAFFGCLYYAALRPEEAVTLRRDNLILPAHGRGKVILTAACPRTGSAWTNTGNSHEPAGLKHRPDGAIRVVPIPPVLVSMLCHHLGDQWHHAGREAVPRRPRRHAQRVGLRPRWHAARRAALGPDLAATALARRPYDLRHAALSLWLNASGTPAEVAARAGNSARVLLRSTCTAPTARKTPSASGSKTPLTQAPASLMHHHARKRAVIRTVGTGPDPVRLPASPR